MMQGANRMMSATSDKRDGIYVVKEGGSIFWPSGELRGLAGYVVRGDDPHMDKYWVRGTPAMLVRSDNAVPDPPSEWPTQWRKLAGPDYATTVEKIAEATTKADKAKLEAAKRRKSNEIAKDIPNKDEE